MGRMIELFFMYSGPVLVFFSFDNSYCTVCETIKQVDSTLGFAGELL